MDIHYGWDLGMGNFIISLVVFLSIYGALFYLCFKVIKRNAIYVLLSGAFLLSLICLIFDAYYGFIVTSIIAGVALSVTLYANLGDLRAFLAAPFKRSSSKSTNFGVEKIFDRKARNQQIELAVMQLSKTRTGAIMTFEKNTTLKDLSKNGVPVHAPISAELLVTIFYPGTRLHDGAVVIHGNEIVAASVFFTPTTKPFAGKYGSRHRAAIGISEVSDAITVVVSEETGRISIAADGELNTVDPDNFLKVFETYMSRGNEEE